MDCGMHVIRLVALMATVFVVLQLLLTVLATVTTEWYASSDIHGM